MKFQVRTRNTGEAQTIDVNAQSFGAMQDGKHQTLASLIQATVGQVEAGVPSITQQLAAQLNLSKGAPLKMALDATGYIGPDGAQALSVGGDGAVTGRLVTQAVLFDAIETHLRDDLSGYPKMLRSQAALVRNITGTRFETPILDFTRPANSRPQPIAQASEPVRMLTLRTSQRQGAILGDSIGIEYADQVLENITIDVVALSLKRQAEESAAALAMYQIMTLLNGDADYGIKPLAGEVLGGVAKASVLDPACPAGKLSQVAWVKWLWRNNLRRTITTVITDLDGALAIENRIGRPVVTGDNAKSPRIDTLDVIANPRWPDKVDVIITQDPEWPAGTIVGFDKKYAYNHITSTSTDYKAMEELVIRRTTKMRFDSGSQVERFMADAWDLLDFN